MRIELPTSEASTTGLLGIVPETLPEVLAPLGEKPYRADQVREWIYERGVTSFDEMSNLPKLFRARLAEKFHLYEATLATEQIATDHTRKLLLRWADGNTSECVLIPAEERRTACISTQVGCPVGCVFCASGLEGLARNLTAAQIVEQVMQVRARCADGPRLSNIVVMGLGEPLANYDNLMTALRVINSLAGVGIGARKITVSTVGLPKQMRRLAEEGLQINLALSLHAPTDELRARLIPWAEGVKIAELADACRYFFDKTHREITLEYVLLGKLNDAPEHAEAVARLCKTMRANVNLLRYNPVEGLPYERPTAEAAQLFLDTLRARGVNAHLRRSRGLDIDSACGQLRRRHASTTAS